MNLITSLPAFVLLAELSCGDAAIIEVLYQSAVEVRRQGTPTLIRRSRVVFQVVRSLWQNSKDILCAQAMSVVASYLVTCEEVAG